VIKLPTLISMGKGRSKFDGWLLYELKTNQYYFIINSVSILHLYFVEILTFSELSYNFIKLQLGRMHDGQDGYENIS